MFLFDHQVNVVVFSILLSLSYSSVHDVFGSALDLKNDYHQIPVYPIHTMGIMCDHSVT